jgi:hypothetical protein
MRTCFSLLVAVLTTAPLLAQNPDSTDASQGRQISVPRQLGPFTLARQQRYDDPSAGTMFRYLSPDTVPVDVFLYPGPDFDTGCPADCALEVIAAETKGFRDGFPMMRERGYVDSIEVVSEDTLRPDPDDQWKLGRALRMRVVDEGRILRSDFVVWYLPTYRVKLRATYADREPMRAYVRFFTDSLIGAIIEQSRIATAQRNTMMTVTLAGAPAEHVGTIAAAMRSLGYAIQDSAVDERASWLQTVPRTDWTGSAMMERFGRAGAPPLQLLAQLMPKGDSTVLRLAARKAQDAEGNDDTVVQMSLAAVIELMSTVTKTP